MFLSWLLDLEVSSTSVAKVCISYIIFWIIATCFSVYTHAGVEKNNDDAKRNYFSSNRHDAAKEILATEARLETLRNGTQDRESCVRQKRKYEESDSVYWNESIRTQRQPTQSPPSWSWAISPPLPVFFYDTALTFCPLIFPLLYPSPVYHLPFSTTFYHLPFSTTVYHLLIFATNLPSSLLSPPVLSIKSSKPKKKNIRLSRSSTTAFFCFRMVFFFKAKSF